MKGMLKNVSIMWMSNNDSSNFFPAMPVPKTQSFKQSNKLFEL